MHTLFNMFNHELYDAFLIIGDIIYSTISTNIKRTIIFGYIIYYSIILSMIGIIFTPSKCYKIMFISTICSTTIYLITTIFSDKDYFIQQMNKIITFITFFSIIVVTMCSVKIIFVSIPLTLLTLCARIVCVNAIENESIDRNSIIIILEHYKITSLSTLNYQTKNWMINYQIVTTYLTVNYVYKIENLVC